MKIVNFMLIVVVLLSVILVSGCATDSVVVDKKEVVSSNLSEVSTLSDFLGKPSVIVFGGLFCPHCRKAIPVFKTDIYDAYGDNINVWVNVVDKKKFDVDIPQGFNPNLMFEEITKSECGYVPSWVVLDENLNVVDKSCGGEKEIKDIKADLDSLLKK